MSAYVLAPEGSPARDTQDLEFLEHAEAMHGMKWIECPGCRGEGCAKCDGEGTVCIPPASEPCALGCCVAARLEAMARSQRS